MWTYAAYILNGVRGKYNLTEIQLKDFQRFALDTLSKEQKVAFWDGPCDLAGDLRYLEQLGIIVCGPTTIKILDMEKLYSVSRIVQHAAWSTKIGLFQSYIERIDKALDKFEHYELPEAQVVMCISYDITIGDTYVDGELDIYELPTGYQNFIRNHIKRKESKWIEETLRDMGYRDLS